MLTNDLWNQGEIPDFFKPLLPNNARFLPPVAPSCLSSQGPVMLDQNGNELKTGDRVAFHPQNIFETDCMYSHLGVMTGKLGVVIRIVNEDQVDVHLDEDPQINEFTEGFFLGRDFIKQ